MPARTGPSRRVATATARSCSTRWTAGQLAWPTSASALRSASPVRCPAVRTRPAALPRRRSPPTCSAPCGAHRPRRSRHRRVGTVAVVVRLGGARVRRADRVVGPVHLRAHLGRRPAAPTRLPPAGPGGGGSSSPGRRRSSPAGSRTGTPSDSRTGRAPGRRRTRTWPAEGSAPARRHRSRLRRVTRRCARVPLGRSELYRCRYERTLLTRSGAGGRRSCAAPGGSRPSRKSGQFTSQK